MDIVNKVYPHVVRSLGGSACKVEVHNNIYKRIGAVGIEDLMKDNNPYAQYDWEKRKIYLYQTNIRIQDKIKRYSRRDMKMVKLIKITLMKEQQQMPKKIGKSI